MQQELSLRALLAAAGGLAATGVVSGDDSVSGGTMTLNQAYNTAGDLWQGPDSAKSNVSPDEGRLYVAVDTQIEYYGDGSVWQKMGIGSQAEPVPSVSTNNATVNNELNVNDLISSFDSDHFVEFVERSIDNTNRKSLSDQQSNLSGAAIINDNTNDQTCFVVAKASGGPIIVDQTGSGFTETVGNQGTVNIYNANSTHQLENETGGSVEVNIIAFGVGF
jgi:hypothetical protein